MAELSCLFTPTSLGTLTLKHKVAMSALTRLRNDPATETPRDLNATYYEQRTSNGGLIVAEGTAPVPEGRGYIRAPNLYTPESIEAWKGVTSRVHAKGGHIFAQLMHAGRVSHSSLLPGNMIPLAPSPVKMEGLVHTALGKVPYEEPREMTKADISAAVDGFAKAAKAAIEAGFDGIELHGGNGYLLQSFLAKKTNLRTDNYGGSVENRARFVFKVIDACAAAIGAEKVAIKLQSGVTFSDLVEPEDDVLAQLAYLGPQLESRALAYVCLSSLNSEPYFRFVGLSEPNFSVDIFRFFRQHYKGLLIVNGSLTPEKAAEYILDGTADVVSFGAIFISNANLPDLIRAGKPLNYEGASNMQAWYGSDPAIDEKYYTDWPLVEV